MSDRTIRVVPGYGESLRRQLEAIEWTQSQLVSESRVSRQTISRAINRNEVSNHTRRRIDAALERAPRKALCNLWPESAPPTIRTGGCTLRRHRSGGMGGSPEGPRCSSSCNPASDTGHRGRRDQAPCADGRGRPPPRLGRNRPCRPWHGVRAQRDLRMGNECRSTPEEEGRGQLGETVGGWRHGGPSRYYVCVRDAATVAQEGGMGCGEDRR